MVTIRLARGGRIHRPVYTLVAADSRCARDGRFLEKLGQYDPQDEKQPLRSIKVQAIANYLKNGAGISHTVRTLLKRNKINVHNVEGEATGG